MPSPPAAFTPGDRISTPVAIATEAAADFWPAKILCRRIQLPERRPAPDRRRRPRCQRYQSGLSRPSSASIPLKAPERRHDPVQHQGRSTPVPRPQQREARRHPEIRIGDTRIGRDIVQEDCSRRARVSPPASRLSRPPPASAHGIMAYGEPAKTRDRLRGIGRPVAVLQLVLKQGMELSTGIISVAASLFVEQLLSRMLLAPPTIRSASPPPSSSWPSVCWPIPARWATPIRSSPSAKAEQVRRNERCKNGVPQPC